MRKSTWIQCDEHHQIHEGFLEGRKVSARIIQKEKLSQKDQIEQREAVECVRGLYFWRNWERTTHNTQFTERSSET